MSFHLIKKEDKDNNLTVATVFDGTMGMLYRVTKNVDKFYVEHLSESSNGETLLATEAKLDDSTALEILKVAIPSTVLGIKKLVTTHYELSKEEVKDNTCVITQFKVEGSAAH
ncbi:hypothetical protein AGENTSMITH_177 [Bacillus phage vB_BspM_AgentSmith]|nr:hypothetical protein AGENTSMITH_177 [Bacillus phage vB_BspM_AgentSmith]